MKQREIDSEIMGLKCLLSQNDYIARKISFEVAKAFKEKFPETEMPVLDEYLEIEEKAQEMRDRINTLLSMEAEADDEEF